MKETEKMSHDERVKRADDAVNARAEDVRGDRYRLRYHFMPPAQWMNDPNGLIHFRGEYHLFYQHHPYGDQWGPMHWGHAKSKELMRWEHLPVALAPSEPYELGDQGGYGCWSGSAVEHDGNMLLFYTGHVDGGDPMEVQCMASSSDGVRFEKYEANPVIAVNPELGSIGFRDPKVWKHGGLWYMIVGSGKNGRGRALLYRSSNLTEWEFVSIAAESDGTHGDMWECPDLFPLGGKHVLILSPMKMEGTKNLYFVGDMDYESGIFTPEYEAKIDDGFDFYAAQTMLDDRGRRILIGWMDMWGSKLMTAGRGWYGAMTLPRELKLRPDGTLASLPVEEYRTLRLNGKMFADVNITAGESMAWDIPQAAECFVEIDLVDTTATEIELRLTGLLKEEEATVMRFGTLERKLEVDRDRSGIGDGGICSTVLPQAGESELKLQLFVDTSSVELFVNDGQRVLTNRIYPISAERRLEIVAVGGTVRLSHVEIWQLGGLDEQA